MHIGFTKQNNKKGSKLKVGDYVRTFKHKSIFAKGYVQSWSEEVLMVKKGKTLCFGHMLLVTLKVKEFF